MAKEIKKYLDLTGVSTLKSNLEAVMDAKDAVVSGKIGELTDLNTDAKADIVAAINEALVKIENGGSGSKVTMSTSTPDGVAKRYTFTQGTTAIGSVDIPKDLVVNSGTVEKDPAGQPAGTYIVLTLNDDAATKLYINVGTLVDIYTAKASATQIQVAIDSITREISATVVAGSIGSAELAANAVTTAKIADANVTKAKLAQGVQDSLDLADSAIQSVGAGTANGTISVDGSDIAVTGLGSAAYTNTTDYATAAQGKKADSAVQAVVEGVTNGTIKVDGAEVAVHGLGSAAYTSASDYDAAGTAVTKANAVLGTVSDDADAVTVYGVKAAVAGVDTRVAALENVELTAITEAEINALFAAATRSKRA